MRACFHGQNIFALGYGVATLQSPRLVPDTIPPNDTPDDHSLPPYSDAGRTLLPPQELGRGPL